MDVDVDIAWKSYLARFAKHFGERHPGAFVKFGNHMVQKLQRDDFEDRLRQYIRFHRECQRVLASGGTINDVIVLEFDEAAAWLCLEAPDLLEIFQEDLGEAIDELLRA